MTTHAARPFRLVKEDWLDRKIPPDRHVASAHVAMSGTEGGGESEESPRSTHTPLAPSFLPYLSLAALEKKNTKNPAEGDALPCPSQSLQDAHRL